MLFRVILEEARELLSEAGQRIVRLDREGKGLVKDVRDKTGKARKTKAGGDIQAAKGVHDKAIVYAKRHGYPNLLKQLIKHKKDLPSRALPSKKIAIPTTKQFPRSISTKLPKSAMNKRGR